MGDVLVGLPAVSKASEVGHDEIDVGILGSEHVDDFRPADDVHEDRQAEGHGRFAHLARRHGFKAVYLDSTKFPASGGVPDHGEDAARIAPGVHENKSDQPPGIAGYD